ncbi:hypothetical protein E2C01_079300 [Portunus trituberculatus]|nr:hypothetical protein [Portunus trituberculatus]
MSLASGS